MDLGQIIGFGSTVVLAILGQGAVAKIADWMRAGKEHESKKVDLSSQLLTRIERFESDLLEAQQKIRYSEATSEECERRYRALAREHDSLRITLGTITEAHGQLRLESERWGKDLETLRAHIQHVEESERSLRRKMHVPDTGRFSVLPPAVPPEPVKPPPLKPPARPFTRPIPRDDEDAAATTQDLRRLKK
jgi:hypothetical protein